MHVSTCMYMYTYMFVYVYACMVRAYMCMVCTYDYIILLYQYYCTCQVHVYTHHESVDNILYVSTESVVKNIKPLLFTTMLVLCAWTT